MSQTYDLNEADPNTFECIPDNTQVPVIFHFIQGDTRDDLHATKDGRGRMVKLEAVVTDGPYAKRKMFLNMILSTSDMLDEGHKKAVDITKATMRAIVEAHRGIAPQDETAAAMAARKIAVHDLDKMECTVLVGIEKGQGTYTDKNIIKRIIPVGKAAPVAAPPDGAPPSAAAKAAPATKTKQQAAW